MKRHAATRRPKASVLREELPVIPVGEAPARRPRPASRFPLWGVLALPGGAVFGSLLGIFVGALFGIPGIGAAVGAALGVGIGISLLAAAIVIVSGRD
jgi:hypothetical protein